METYTRDKIAIIGMGCRTAGANSPPEVWDLLVNSRDVQRNISRFNVSAYHNPNRKFKRGLTNVKQAYLMDDDLVTSFDHGFFHISPNEAPWMDPQHRHLLEVSYEAIESAGIPLDTFKGTDTGVFTGVESSDYALVLGRDPDNSQRFVSTGMAGCMAANRISFFFNLSGPSLVIDTACSSSMTALHQAARALEHGDCSMALVCGSNILFTPDMFVVASEMGFISPSGRCQSFDMKADGYGRGEGVLVLLLKPLKAAIADLDPIRAVLAGIRINHDGRTEGIMMPSAKSQENNMRALYESKGIDPDTIQYVEAHVRLYDRLKVQHRLTLWCREQALLSAMSRRYPQLMPSSTYPLTPDQRS
jgi:acyl transferase domain-containing protein